MCVTISLHLFCNVFLSLINLCIVFCRTSVTYLDLIFQLKVVREYGLPGEMVPS